MRLTRSLDTAAETIDVAQTRRVVPAQRCSGFGRSQRQPAAAAASREREKRTPAPSFRAWYLLAGAALLAAALAAVAGLMSGSAQARAAATAPSNTSLPTISGSSSVVQSDPTAAVTANSAPVTTQEPTISGSLIQGQTLSGTTGSWAGTTPISYAYQWVRCGTDGGAPDGSNCAFISGATGSSYALQGEDVGRRMRLRITATNGAGAQTVASNATGTIAATPTAAPKNTKEPSVVGTAKQGQTLTANIGGWSGTAPIGYAYQWLRCDANGNNCAVLSGQTKSTFVPGASELNTRIRVRITASNSKGSAVATCNPTTAVQSSASAPPALPAGAIKLPSGKYSIPASSVSLPARLIVDAVAFTPNPVRSRQSNIELRVHVVDTRGYVVRDALVFARSTPIVTTGMSNQPTGQDGWVTLRLAPHVDFPLRNGHNVQFFVRARKPGDNVLAGVSTRRLVQVRTAR